MVGAPLFNDNLVNTRKDYTYMEPTTGTSHCCLITCFSATSRATCKQPTASNPVLLKLHSASRHCSSLRSVSLRACQAPDVCFHCRWPRRHHRCAGGPGVILHAQSEDGERLRPGLRLERGQCAPEQSEGRQQHRALCQPRQVMCQLLPAGEFHSAAQPIVGACAPRLNHSVLITHSFT